MRRRIVAIGVGSGLLGVACIAVALAWSSRTVIGRSAFPMITWVMERGERARCLADPAGWQVAGPNGARLWAFDGATYRGANPAAPALSAETIAALDADAQALEPRGIGRGSLAAIRIADRGACAVIAAEIPPLVSRTGVALFFLLGGLIAAGLGAAIAAFSSARPLRALHASQLALADSRAALQRQIADVAHDVRTPIASLQLALEQALSASERGDVDACLLRAVHDVVYIGGLIGNLRMASDLRAGADPTQGTTRLTEIVTRAVLRAQVLARRKGVALDVAVPDAELELTANPIAVEQAIGNLIDNAVTHVDPGCHVAVILEPEPGARFRFVVVDDGPGVASADLP